MLECVVNVSEGADPAVLGALRRAVESAVLDVHTDAHHNRSVWTLVGEDAPRRLATEAVRLVDLRDHAGVHPRFGAVDVVPFVAVPGTGAGPDDAVAARDAFGLWAADALGLPGFAYGPERSLPDVRRGAFTTLGPTWGPGAPHPTAGAVAVGARPVLVAYNLWMGPECTLERAREVARAVRGPALRALGLRVGDRVQVSMNLVDPSVLGPGEAWDAVAAHAPVAGAELVGLVPASVLDRTPEERWERLDLGPERTIEARVEALGPR